MEAATDLATKMRERADKDGLPEGHPLRELAAAFDEACKGYYSEPQTYDVRKFMGAWSRARRAWCECSGDPLI